MYMNATSVTERSKHVCTIIHRSGYVYLCATLEVYVFSKTWIQNWFVSLQMFVFHDWQWSNVRRMSMYNMYMVCANLHSNYTSISHGIVPVVICKKTQNKRNRHFHWMPCSSMKLIPCYILCLRIYLLSVDSCFSLLGMHFDYTVSLWWNDFYQCYALYQLMLIAAYINTSIHFNTTQLQYTHLNILSFS